MPDSSFHSDDELIRYIRASGESDNIDAKGPMSWDGGPQSASLAKDIAAFANSRDGGVLVIGKDELDSDHFEYTGLTEDQASSFETTKVATWVKNQFSPPVRLICHRQVYEGKIFVVITVSEFDDIPIFCTKSIHDSTDHKKLLLKEKTIYVRNAQAESAPLGSVDDFRTLIGLATSKRGNEMLAMFGSMLKGQPLLPTPNDDERFQAELDRIEASLTDVLKPEEHKGGWKLVLRPGIYIENRWPEIKDLEKIVARRAIRIREQFPPSYRGAHPREWGICNDTYGDVWTLSRSGLFLYWKTFSENDYKFECKWRGPDGMPSEPDISAGEWISYTHNIYRMTEFFAFMSRFAEEFSPGERLVYNLIGGPLRGRKLVSTDVHVFIGHGEPDPCRAERFQRKKDLSIEDFRSNWEDECARAMKQFFELFPDQHIEVPIFKEWIVKFMNRN